MLSNRAIFQNAWVVDDLFAAIKKWVDFYGVGPFYASEHLKLDGLRYRGTPFEIDMSGALAQAGDVQIELIQQHNDGPSVYRDQFAPGESGFHHVCYFSEDFEADRTLFEANGYAVAMDGDTQEGTPQFGYFDTRADFGIFTELVAPTEGFLARCQMLKDVAKDWDGTDPIRINTADGGYRVP